MVGMVGRVGMVGMGRIKCPHPHHITRTNILHTCLLVSSASPVLLALYMLYTLYTPLYMLYLACWIARVTIT